ncbi:hypothetical protein SASPL_138587 [Salvia splendens]|uniref:Uncharacterized protein n=1 Tax=Salvia splendens TaxID=180675 RepID=A0A8X8WV12_SALSN|nr:hypothetical protein SASPL_138587 [Salvia splendens]
MATAFAALVSLESNLRLIYNHPKYSFHFEEEQIRSLEGSVSFLIDFMKSYDNSLRPRKQAAEALEMRIAHAAQVAEDVIESHIVDHIRSGKTRSPRFLLDLQKAIQDMDYMRRKALNVRAQNQSKVIAPYEIWEMLQLRFSDEVCKRIHNIRELRLSYCGEVSSYYCPGNLSRFNQLQVLWLQFDDNSKWREFVTSLTFPSKLMELRLRGSGVDWEDASSTISAMRTLVEQEEQGNDSLRLDIYFEGDEETLESFNHKVQEEGLTSTNLSLHLVRS